MDKRIVMLITALIILIMPVWFTVSAVHAAGLETDTVFEDNAGEFYSDSDISGDSLEEREDESESEPETEGVTENESESADGEDSETGLEETKPEETKPEETKPEDDTELETKPEDKTEAESKPEDDTKLEDEPEEDTELESEPESLLLGLSVMLGGLGGGGTDEIFRFEWENQYDTYYLEIGADPADLSLAATARGYFSWVNYVDCDITWHYEDIDSDTPGRCQITGDILLPDDYTASCDTTAYYAVIIYDPNGPPSVMAVKVGSYMRNNMIVPLGTSDAELEDIFINKAWLGRPPLNIWIETEDGDIYYGKLTGWNTSLVDTSEVGVYYPFFIDPPPGVGLPEGEGPGAEIAGAEIIVLDPDVVSLRAYNYDSDTGSVYIHWFKEISEPELWFSIDDGEWEPVSDDYYFWSDSLRLELGNNNSIFQSGHVYEFQVRYENGGVSEDTLIMDFTSGKPEFSSIGGDRTGGDREENPLPPVDPDDGEPGNPGIEETPPTPDNLGSGESTPTSGNSSSGTPTPMPVNSGSEIPAMPILSADLVTMDELSDFGAVDNERKSQEQAAPAAAELDSGSTLLAVHILGTDSLAEQEPETLVMPPAQNEDVPLPNAPAPAMDTATILQPQPSPYKDGWARVVMAGMIGIAGAGVFWGFVRKRAVKRP